MHCENGNEETRIDKWLWTARFFKTRSLAAEAVNGGKVEVNGARAKPSRAVRPGDEINLRRGPYEWTVVVKHVAKLRGPAAQARSRNRATQAGASAGIRSLRQAVEKGSKSDRALHQASLINVRTDNLDLHMGNRYWTTHVSFQRS